MHSTYQLCCYAAEAQNLLQELHYSVGARLKHVPHKDDLYAVSMCEYAFFKHCFMIMNITCSGSGLGQGIPPPNYVVQTLIAWHSCAV